MPSTGKQKVIEKRPIQSDVMSDLENSVLMLGNLFENAFVNDPDNGEEEVDSVSIGLRENTNTLGKFLGLC